jgi:hypothetical protein
MHRRHIRHASSSRSPARLLLVAFATRVPAAQGAIGSILGTVSDSSGSVIPGATVTARNTGTGAIQLATSDAQGRYRIPVLPVGDYEVQTELSGFQTVVHTGIRLSAGADVVVDFKMPIGQISELLTGNGRSPLVNTTSASLGTGGRSDADPRAAAQRAQLRGTGARRSGRERIERSGVATKRVHRQTGVLDRSPARGPTGRRF